MKSEIDDAPPSDQSDGNGLFAGHPKGLPTLFFTEMWERFSYYGMRAILVLYMVAPLKEGGLAFSINDSAQIYGTYTMLVYMSSIPGGLIADKILGFRVAVLIGGIIIALGHFTMAFPSITTFYLGLFLIIMGTGLLKPNISSMVGNLYPQNDHRRDSGFSIFYMGVNIGGAISPIVCGFLAQSQEFRDFLARHGIDPFSSWHFGFAAAGFGMMLGLTQYVLGRNRLAGAGDKKTAEAKKIEKAAGPLTNDEIKRCAAIALLFIFTVLFWTVYEQGGSSLNVFTDRLIDCQILGWHFPSSFLQSFQAVFVIILAPIFSVLWLKLGDREPSSPAKFSYGLLFLAIGIVAMVPAAMLAAHGKISPLWVIFVYLFEVIGEMCLSPVGLSTCTKLAPLRFLGLTMGCWYLGSSFGNRLAGFFAGSFNPDSTSAMVTLFGGMAVASLVAAGILVALTPTIRKLMTGVH
jgi:POT family proton-dependent oligopeptide transporter